HRCDSQICEQPSFFVHATAGWRENLRRVLRAAEDTTLKRALGPVGANVAVFHCDVRSIGRSGGYNAVAAAAYRSASRLLDERDAKVYDFTRKKGVEHCEIVLPEDVEATWAYDRETLWNSAERAEKRKNSRVAREVGVALPWELSREQQVALARALAQDL